MYAIVCDGGKIAIAGCERVLYSLGEVVTKKFIEFYRR